MTNTAYHTFKGKFDIISRQYQRLDGTSNTGKTAIALNALEERPSIHRRHIYIKKNDIRQDDQLPQNFHCLLTV